jgi:hypothetical protein
VFWEKWCAVYGFLMVNLWRIRGELWCVDGAYLVVKNTPLFSSLFLGVPKWDWWMGCW